MTRQIQGKGERERKILFDQLVYLRLICVCFELKGVTRFKIVLIPETVFRVIIYKTLNSSFTVALF